MYNHPYMTLPDFDLVRPRPTDGLDPLSGNAALPETSFPHGDKPKEVEPPKFIPKVNAGFDPQPPAGIDLSVIDPLPGHYDPTKSEPE